MQLSDYHYLGFIMGDRNLQKIIHTALDLGIYRFVSRGLATGIL